MIILIDTEKAFDKIQHSFMIKALNKAAINRNYINIRKATCEKLIAILNGKEWKAFPLRSGRKQGCLLSPSLFSIVLEVQTKSII